jgi:hypothetical protein
MRCSLFTALVVLLSCGTAARSQEDARRDRAGRALERLGARTGLSAQAVWPNLTKETKKFQRQNKYALVVIGTDWKGGIEGLKHLRALPGLRGVMFSHPDFSDEWCECLRGMTGLKEVYVQGEHFTDKGLRCLRGLRELEALSLIMTQITDKGLTHLEGMTKLRWLSLAVTRVSDAGMAHLRRAPDLRHLNLDTTDVTGDGLAHLKGATRMEWLRLSGPLVYGSGAGLRHLKGMKHLKYLSIGELSAPEAEMKALLRQCKGLDRIEAGDLVFTRDGWKTREALTEEAAKQRIRKRVLDNIKD